jgi:hypothetical protein
MPALALLTAAIAWLQPPPVLPLPPRGGPEAPPRPYGIAPAPGQSAPPSSSKLAHAQNRAMLTGPFPRGGLVRGVSEGTLLLSESPATRAQAFARIRAAGAGVVRIPVDWRDVVSASPPAGFDARDPSSPGYHFELIDAAVRSAAAAGLTPLLVVSHAPAFAESPHRWPYAYPGSWAPSPGALEAFAAALARRYDGSFADPLAPGQALPRVSLFQAWNEPNLARYLEPQWVAVQGRWSAFSPLLYRQLLNAFYSGVESVEPADRVVAAGVAPNGEPPGEGRMAPVTFLRGLLCLPAGRCPDPPHFDVLDFHPLSVGDPDTPASSSLDVAISDAAKVTDLLRRAERLHTALPLARKPVWVTELNWESAPPAPGGVPPGEQAQWLSRALHRLWVAGVGLVAWQFLVDPYPGVRLATPTGGEFEYERPAGLYSAGTGGNPAHAQPKPFLQGFVLPFDPLRLDRARVRVWALLSEPGQAAPLQRRAPDGTWRTIASLRADGAGVLNVLVTLHGTATLRLQAGSLTSAAALVPGGRSRL